MYEIANNVERSSGGGRTRGGQTDDAHGDANGDGDGADLSLWQIQ